MRISELAREAGVGVETVRFYQRKGLLPRARGDRPGNRHYDLRDVDRLKFIKRAQSAGFTLSRIRDLLELDDSEDRETIRALDSQLVEELDQRIEHLSQVRESMAALVSECAGGVTGPCPIIGAFAGRNSKRRA